MKNFFTITLTVLAVLIVFGLYESKPKEYSNPKLGFVFSYPKEWGVEEAGVVPDSFSVYSPDNSQILNITYTNSLDETSLQAPEGKRSSLKEALSYELTDIQPKKIDNDSGYIGIFHNSTINYTGHEIYVEHNGHLYNLSYENDSPEIERIIKSFHFLK